MIPCTSKTAWQFSQYSVEHGWLAEIWWYVSVSKNMTTFSSKILHWSVKFNKSRKVWERIKTDAQEAEFCSIEIEKDIAQSLIGNI